MNSRHVTKARLIKLSRQYAAALQRRLKQGPRASVLPAGRLGRQAMARGLGTLDLARIHEKALASLGASITRDGAIKRAEAFFVEAISPIEQNHRAMRDANVHLMQVNKALRRRTGELVVANRQLQREIVRRRTAEVALRKSEQHYSRLLEQSRQLQEQLRHLSRQLLLAQEEERKRISRELHDEIAQTLTGINVRLAALKTEATLNTKGLQRKIASTQRLVEKSVDIVHRFARELRPTVLDDLGLIPALHSYMQEFTKRTGILIRFTAFAGVEQLNSSKRTVLYRVVQAALTNAAQHAQANRVAVSLKKRREAVRMEIHDNGNGFDVEHVLFAKRYKRLGLLGMRERVEMVGGSFAVESVPGKGTTIRAELPFNNGHKVQE
jgi:signal transduction histidine kinase